MRIVGEARRLAAALPRTTYWTVRAARRHAGRGLGPLPRCRAQMHARGEPREEWPVVLQPCACCCESHSQLGVWCDGVGHAIKVIRCNRADIDSTFGLLPAAHGGAAQQYHTWQSADCPVT